MVKTTDSASNALEDVLKVSLSVSKVLDPSKPMPPAHGGDPFSTRRSEKALTSPLKKGDFDCNRCREIDQQFAVQIRIFPIFLPLPL